MQFNKYVPIGYICTAALAAKIFANDVMQQDVFGRMGSPAWGVTSLLEKDFSGWLEPNNLVYRNPFSSGVHTWIDTPNYLRLPLHKEPLDEVSFDRLKTKLNALKDRLLQTLASDSKVLFIRCQEPMSYPDWGERDINEYKSEYAVDELSSLKTLSDLLKVKYSSLEFKILYMSDAGFFADTDNNIVGIPSVPCDYRDKKVYKKMKDHLKSAAVAQHLSVTLS